LIVAKIRPQDRGDIEFGVGQLPEQKVAQAHFAAGADEQIGIADFGSLEVAGDAGLIDGFGIERAGGGLAGQFADGLGELLSAAVAQSEIEDEAGIVLQAGDSRLESDARGRRQLFEVADNGQADVIAVEFGRLAADRDISAATSLRGRAQFSDEKV
jgi:hypothetical protein